MKYGNTKTVVDGIRFDSQHEAARWTDLNLMQKAGAISGLTRQVPFVIAPGVRITHEKRARPAMRFVADFVYSDPECGIVVEDAKGMDTQVSRLKRHLMKSVHGIDVRLV